MKVGFIGLFPFIARWPGKIEPGSLSDHVGHFGDFLATAAGTSEGAGLPI